MRKLLMAGLLAVGAGLGTGGAARAQYYGGPQGPFAPNFYNTQNQPLSPYLNLFRGTNPAVNYFYGVRPGTVGGYGLGGLGGMGNYGMMGMQRQTFFPVVDTLEEYEPRDPREPGMRPTGHPVGFNNYMGYMTPQSGNYYAPWSQPMMYGMGRGMRRPTTAAYAPAQAPPRPR